jgi:hypothetical protein
MNRTPISQSKFSLIKFHIFNILKENLDLNKTLAIIEKFEYLRKMIYLENYTLDIFSLN